MPGSNPTGTRGSGGGPKTTRAAVAPREAVLAVRNEVAKVVVGQEGTLSGLVAALLVRGHVLLEGVPGVAKTLLVKTVAATRLMGAECIISGIRPQIAQTIVHLGVDLGDVTTKATLADAFRVALSRTGRMVTSATTKGDHS